MTACIFCCIIKGESCEEELDNREEIESSAGRGGCVFCGGESRACHQPFISIIVIFASQLTISSLLGEIPCLKLFESEKILAFLDIGPLSQGHAVR
jgi:diadenosine tetraphosphate (Ap4A) HIT family hydrolase